MENVCKPDIKITKKHFAELNYKIQNKYEEMQKKLEKCKSMDTLIDNNEDYLYKEVSKNFTSVNDLNKTNEQNNDSKTKCFVSHLTIVDSRLKETATKEVVCKDAALIRYDSISNTSERCDSESESVLENNFFDRNYFKTSLESLNEIIKESDDSSELNSPPPQSLRSRIKSRLQKRRTDEKIAKEKRKNSKKVEKGILSQISTIYSINNTYSLRQIHDKHPNIHSHVITTMLSNVKTNDVVKTYKKTKVRLATVTIALIELTGLEPTKLEDKPRVLMYRFRLGAEKYKSKLIKSHKEEIKFQELFNLPLYEDDSILEITLFERDYLIGRNTINLSNYEKEKTHKIRFNFDNEYTNVQTFLLLTISGTTLINTLYDIDESEIKENEYLLQRKYAWYRLHGQLSDVGSLSVIVYGAKGLSGQDCYCILSLNNERIQTQTDYKTNEPSWMKIISFALTDVTSVLEVIIYDEKKNEEVGRVSIPLLRVTRGKKWYALKCSNLKDRAKGTNPRVLLEINLNFNFIKAAYRVINPKETNYLQVEEKLDRHIFARNLSRAKVVTTWILDAYEVFKTSFQWESMKLNVVTLAMWVVFWYNVKTWMLPLLLLIPFMWYKSEENTNWKSRIVKEFAAEKHTDTKENKEDKNTSLRQKIHNLQEIIQSIQNIIGKIANFGESMKNLFNFTEPFLSLLAIVMILVLAFAMYVIPFNYICMVWGINKFLKKIFRPHVIPNNEIMDLLSRIPDDEILNNFEELPLGEISEDNTRE